MNKQTIAFLIRAKQATYQESAAVYSGGSGQFDSRDAAVPMDAEKNHGTADRQ